MLETNIRIVQPGVNLRLNVRRADVISQDQSPELRQRACNALRKKHGLAAVPCPGRNALFVLSSSPVPTLVLEEDDWRLEVRDSEQTKELRFANYADRDLLAQLLERCLISQVERRTQCWAMDGYRTWYQPEPFITSNGVAAWRRYEIAGVAIDDVGVGLVIDIGTAFFTVPSVADFFRNDLPEKERRRLQAEFDRLGARQQGQKGTLIYDLGKSKHKCYFDSYVPGLMASTPIGMRVQGQDYPHLKDYYRQKHGIVVNENGTVAKVSFAGIDRPQPVLAEFLRLRVMNEFVPDSLKQVDKIEPAERSTLIEEFWELLGNAPLGKTLPGLKEGFWRPPNDKIIRAKFHDLVFGGGNTLPAPRTRSVEEIRDYYYKRLSYLDKYGCYQVPPTIDRVLHVAIPREIGEEVGNQLAEAVTDCLSRWTRKEISPELLMYDTLSEAIARLRRESRPGVVLFVFENEEPTTYFDLSLELKEWRIKRITRAELARLASRFQFACDESAPGKVAVARYPKGWDSFVEMNALDVLQQMDCVPYVPAGPLHHEARLAIDVGHDRRHFALSLMICRPGAASHQFRLDTKVLIKSDPKHEAINDVVLCDEIVKLCERAMRAGFKNISSMLVVRDGRECGREMNGIRCSQAKLAQNGFLTRGASVDVIDLHKSSTKKVRLWDRSKTGQVRHVLEGDGVLLNQQTVVLANTGAATLHQGTSDPIMLVDRSGADNLRNIVNDEQASCQLNWSSPSVAQRLPLEIKRTDDELKNRSAQEIRRIR